MSREHYLDIRLRVTDESDEVDNLHGLCMAERRQEIQDALSDAIKDVDEETEWETMPDRYQSVSIELVSMEWDDDSDA